MSISKIKLSGAGKTDTIHYYPGTAARSGQVNVMANFAKSSKELMFSIHYKDVGCIVFYQGIPICEQECIPVKLVHSLSTSPTSYITILSKLLTIMGPPQSKVLIRMVWKGAGHGHSHNLSATEEKATGKFTKFKQAGEKWVPEKEDTRVLYKDISYESYGMSGNVTVRVLFANKNNRPLKTITFYLDIRYPGLKELVVSEGDNIELVGRADIHPKNHFGTQKLIDAIKKLAKAYGEACDKGEFDIKGNPRPNGLNKKLWVNDMSLPYGGRYECDHEGGIKAINPFRPGHQEHMFGEEVDFSASPMNAKQNAWFKALEKNLYTKDNGADVNCKNYGFSRIV